jgi:hypothetical protein
MKLAPVIHSDVLLTLYPSARGTQRRMGIDLFNQSKALPADLVQHPVPFYSLFVERS